MGRKLNEIKEGKRIGKLSIFAKEEVNQLKNINETARKAVAPKTRWKLMLPYARRYGVRYRGFSPYEIFQEILDKDEKGRVDVRQEDLDVMLDIVESGPKFSLKDRYKHFFNGNQEGGR